MENGRKTGEAGFTIIEIMIAVVILAVGLLGLTTTSGLVTRMIGRGQRSEIASILALQRMERMRPLACNPARRVAGAETLMRGSQPVARVSWTFADAGNNSIRMRVVVDFVASANRVRTETMETSIICLI